MEQKNFYAREISIFVCGYLAGSVGLLVFLILKKIGYESVAWSFSGAVGGAGAILLAGSLILRDLKRIDASYAGEAQNEASAIQRAEQAEAEAADLNQRLISAETAYKALQQESRFSYDAWASAQAESSHASVELAATKTELDSLRQHSPSPHAIDQAGVSPGGLTFPYATKELDAMRAAVAKYWEGYTAEKRQPTQVEIQMELCKLLGLELANGEAPRKVKALASAIKPVDLPDV